jgi:hypothetical protein
MVHNVPRMLEHSAGVKKRVEVKNVVVRGRRPHGSLHFFDEVMAAARRIARRRQCLKLRRL